MKKQLPNQPSAMITTPPITIPDLSEATELSVVMKHLLKKCAATLNEDLEALTPKDRIMLWKEYGSFFEAESGSGLCATNRGSNSGGDDNDIPGMSIRNINVNVLTKGGPADEKR